MTSSRTTCASCHGHQFAASWMVQGTGATENEVEEWQRFSILAPTARPCSPGFRSASGWDANEPSRPRVRTRERATSWSWRDRRRRLRLFLTLGSILGAVASDRPLSCARGPKTNPPRLSIPETIVLLVLTGGAVDGALSGLSRT